MQCQRFGISKHDSATLFSLFSFSDVWSLARLNSKDFPLFVLAQVIIHATISSLWCVSQTLFSWSWLCSSWLANFTLYYLVLPFIIWQAPRAGKMNQIVRCDWLPEQARWSHLARSGLPAVSRHPANIQPSWPHTWSITHTYYPGSMRDFFGGKAVIAAIKINYLQ